MAKEIERKFLVRGSAWRARDEGELIRQGYLSDEKARTVRVRLAGKPGKEKGSITVKGITSGVSRLEFDYEIPAADAAAMLERLALRPLVEKIRRRIPAEGLPGASWEIDEFLGENAGLVVAEIELPDEGASFVRPGWLGREVSDDPRYFNSNLLAHPFGAWPEAERQAILAEIRGEAD